MRLWKTYFLGKRFFWCAAFIVILFITGHFYYSLYPLARLCTVALLALTLMDSWFMFRIKNGISGRRIVPDRLSNGDENIIHVAVSNFYPFTVFVNIIDELPAQFQKRDFLISVNLKSGNKTTRTYILRPLERGEYRFGALQIYASSILKLVTRKYTFDHAVSVPVYPSYLQMRKYELLAISNRLTEVGIKKIRRKGHTMEFDQIRNYISGDDYRTLNWKATARRARLMVNQYQDEISQQVYSIIDMGRVMKMPFQGLTLLDYAINASLVISNIALLKYDKAGIITFSSRVDTLLPADRKNTQILQIMEVLYRQKTNFKESGYESLYGILSRKVNQRSLILLFTNFETLEGLHRQLPFIRRIARRHLPVVIFFENTELNYLLHKNANSLEEIYIKTIAEKFSFEKKQIVKELEMYGIHSILTAPEHLTVNTINKYLELKAMGFI